MADYYKILTGAIAQQGIEDADARRALYDRVRKVLESQLAGLDPDKSAPIADQHRKTLDDAIAKIEAASVDIVSGAAPKIEPTLPVQKSEDRPIPPSVVVPETIKDAGEAPDEAAPSEAANNGAPETSPSPQAGAYVAPPQRASSVNPRIPVAASTGSTPNGGYLRPPKSGERVANGPTEKRSGARNIFVVFILLLAILAGVGYWQRDNLDAYAGPVIRVVGEYSTMASDKIGELTGLWGMSTAPSADSENVAGVDSDSSDSMLPPVDEATPQTVAGEGGDNDSNAPVNDAPVQVASAPPETPEPEAPAVESPGVTVVEPSQPVPPTTIETPPTTTVVQSQTPPPAASPAPPDAFLLIEGNAAEGQQDDRVAGRVSWSLAGNDNILRFDAQMSGPESSLAIEIAKNEDSGLPASHTVTYTYTPPEAQPDGPVTNFPSLMTRVDDTSASVPLRGVGALILPNQYLMGLSDTPEDREYNLQLLENAKWIVVPVVFETGRRGLFLIEFGETGREMYATAKAAWGDAN